MTDSPRGASAADLDIARPAHPRRWQALGILGALQFILILDLTVVNVALPRINDELGFGDAGLAWVVNGYVLTAAGLLLLGGRLADIFGQRRVFVLGVAVFALGSLACGFAPNPEMLVAGRFVQGVGEALAAPSALGLIVLLFRDSRERTRALGIWGGLSGLGGVSGSVISGVLTDLAHWRFIFWINLPLALAVVVLLPMVLRSFTTPGTRQSVNFTGAILGTLGLVGIVFGVLQVGDWTWTSPLVVGSLVGGVALIGAMVLVESKSVNPIIPLRFFTHRVRTIAYVALVINSGAFFGYVFLLTLFEQQILGFTPLQGGLSYLPLGLAMGAGLAVSTSLMARAGPGILLGTGLLGVATGLLLSSGLDSQSGYFTGILPGLLVIGFSSGLVMPAAVNGALFEIGDADASLGSAMHNVMAQVGGALGLAVLVTIALDRAHSAGALGLDPEVALTEGYTLAFRVGAGAVAMMGVVALFTRRRSAIGR